MRRFLIILMFLTCFRHADGAEQLGWASTQIATIEGGVTLWTKDGELLRLAGVEPSPPSRSLQRQLRIFLKDNILGRHITYQTTGRPFLDRYGRKPVQLYLPDGRWLNGALVAAGLLRVDAGDELSSQVPDLLALEQEARTQQRGGWGPDGPFHIYRAEPWHGPTHRFTIVEGRVRAVANQKKYTYLNFGADWRKDFTVRIDNKNLPSFEGEGLAIETLAGQTVRVRGWVEWRNGPLIQLSVPALLEKVSGNKP